MPMITHVHELGHLYSAYTPKISFNNAESLRSTLEGKVVIFRLVNKYNERADSQDKINAFVNSGGNVNGKSMYRDLVLMRTPAQLEFFLETAFSPDAAPSTVRQYVTDNYSMMEINHPEYRGDYNQGAKQVWALDLMGSPNPYIIADGVMLFDSNLTEAELF